MFEAANPPLGGGWIPQNGTGSLAGGVSRLIVIGASCLTFAFAPIGNIGTGGSLTPENLIKRHERGGYKLSYSESTYVLQESVPRTPSENVARIREVLKPAVTEVASLFGVSRQTIYDWQNGAQPTQANAGKLEDLAAAADVFVAEGISVTPYLLKRRIAGGKTVFEVFRDGGDTENAARQLAQMVLRESNQRRILEARMAGRKLQKIDYSDAGVPALKERS